jgi:hypothetical protein
VSSESRLEGIINGRRGQTSGSQVSIARYLFGHLLFGLGSWKHRSHNNDLGLGLLFLTLVCNKWFDSKEAKSVRPLSDTISNGWRVAHEK